MGTWKHTLLPTHPPKHATNIKQCISCSRVSVVPYQQCEVGLNLQVTGSGGVSGRTFGWKVKVRVGAVEEGFPSLAVRKVGLYNQTRARAGLGVQGAAPHWQSILHIKTEKREREKGRGFFKEHGKGMPFIHPAWTPNPWFMGCHC